MAHENRFLHRIREFFLLRDAEAVVAAYGPEQRARVRAHFDAAERRLAGGRGVAGAVGAAVLLRDAVTGYLRAIDAARHPGAAPPPALDPQAALPQPVDPALALPPLPPNPATPSTAADPLADDRRVRAALAANDPLYFDALDADEAERVRQALERAAAILRRQVEPRSVVHLRASRRGRLAALALVGGYLALSGTRAAFLRTDIALGKPVHSSSRKHNPPSGRELVDGVVGGVAIHTNTEDAPSATIDLSGTYYIDQIAVYNRTDGWFDDCLPLVVELSADGNAFAEVGRRTEHFGVDPPWLVDGKRTVARYVRVRVARRGYLALSEVKVFGDERRDDRHEEKAR